MTRQARPRGGCCGGWFLAAVLLALAPLTGRAQPADPARFALAGPTAGPDDDDLIVVAVADAPQALPGVGGTPRSDYRRLQGYAGSTRSADVAADVARDFRLTEQKFWAIQPLHLRCMLYRVAPGADRDAVLAGLGRDARVQLAQPLNHFETLQTPRTPQTPPITPAAPTSPSSPTPQPALQAAPQAHADAPAYNDPYLGLQRGFAAVGAAEAQRFSRGAGVRVALIDSGVDAQHPDLAGRIASQRDFVGGAHPVPARGERHGTEMAGVIGAAANNAVGIVGIAPQALLLAYRACWSVPGPAGAAGGGADRAARCDSFTLAQALGAAIAADADIINLSLGGPADALLARLALHAMQRGVIVVGALPASGRRDGFPVGLAGVLAVGSSDDAPAPGAPASAGPAGPAGPAVLAAPGRDILTLVPGGAYDFASGSSLAAAHVSGALALLRALSPGLPAATAQRWLSAVPINVCAALQQLRPAALCGGEHKSSAAAQPPGSAAALTPR